MSITPPLSHVAFSGREILIFGHFPEEIGPFSCFCETSSLEPGIGDVVATQSTLNKLACLFQLSQSMPSRCQIGVRDRDGHRAVTAIFLVEDMFLTKIHTERMVVGHLSTVPMVGHNLFDVFKYDCLLGTSTFTAVRLSDSLIHCDVVPSIPGNFSLIGRVEGIPLAGPAADVHVSFETQVLDFEPKVALLGQNTRFRLIGIFQHGTFAKIGGVCRKTALIGIHWFFEFLPNILGDTPFQIGANCRDSPLFSSVVHVVEPSITSSIILYPTTLLLGARESITIFGNKLASIFEFCSFDNARFALMTIDDHTSVCILYSTRSVDLQPLMLSDFFGDNMVSVGFISISSLPELISVSQSPCGSNITLKLEYFEDAVCYRVQSYNLPIIFSRHNLVVLKVLSNIPPGLYTLEMSFCATNAWRSSGHELSVSVPPKVLTIEPSLIFAFSPSVVKLQFSREPLGHFCHFGPFLDSPESIIGNTMTCRVTLGPGVFQFEESSFELKVISRPQIDRVIPSSFVSGHSAAFQLVGTFDDFPNDITVLLGTSSGDCAILNSTIFLCEIDSFFSDSAHLSVVISFIGSSSFVFDTDFSVVVFDDPRPISVSLEDCCDNIIVSSSSLLSKYSCQIGLHVVPLLSHETNSYRCSFPQVNIGNVSFQIFHSLSRQRVFEVMTRKSPLVTFGISPSVASIAGGAFVAIFNVSQSWVPNQCVFGMLLADYSCNADSCGCMVPPIFESKFVVFQLKTNQTTVGNVPFSYVRPIQCSNFFPVTVSSEVFSITIVGQSFIPQTIALVGGIKCVSARSYNDTLMVVTCRHLDPGYVTIELTSNYVEFEKWKNPFLLSFSLRKSWFSMLFWICL